jgi:hypothetical protein
MCIAVMLCRETEDEGTENKAESLFLLSRQHQELPTIRFTFSGHFGRDLTCRERYLPRIFAS